MNKEEVFSLLCRDAAAIFSEEELKKLLDSGRKLKIKLGADPSRPDLHLGHSVVLRKLKLLQDLGHEIIFVIGDTTGMIGDPSGRSKTRPVLSFEQTRKNGQTYLEQVTKILNRKKTSIVYNSQWLEKLGFTNVLELAGKYTLARVMERDDFAKRFSENRPIGLHELFYPLMQGYDSVVLSADIEVGGTDQTFNLLVGRELQRDYGQPAQVVLTFPLLPGLDGKEKMSKSLDNYIGLDESPETMFEKCMQVPDALLPEYFRLTTDLPADLWQSLAENDIRGAHFCYAREIVTLYHGSRQAEAAEQRYRAVAAGGRPEEIPEIHLKRETVFLPTLLVVAGWAPSTSEARRLIAGSAIRMDGNPATDPSLPLGDKNILLKKGKNKFLKIIFDR